MLEIFLELLSTDPIKKNSLIASQASASQGRSRTIDNSIMSQVCHSTSQNLRYLWLMYAIHISFVKYKILEKKKALLGCFIGMHNSFTTIHRNKTRVCCYYEICYGCYGALILNYPYLSIQFKMKCCSLVSASLGFHNS